MVFMAGGQRKPLVRKDHVGWFVLLACLLGLTVGIAAGVASLLVWSWHPRTGACFQLSSMPSPVERDVPIVYHAQQFNGSLMMENIYRQPGSPEVDAAWEALGVDCESRLCRSNHGLANLAIDRPLRVPVDVGLQTGFASDQVRVNAEYGGGFVGNVDGLHQLHCAVSHYGHIVHLAFASNSAADLS